MEAEVGLQEPTKDEIIKCNLRVFLPYIIHCIPATILLTRIQLYDKGQRKEIFSLSCRNPHDATSLALQILLDLEEQGQFTALMEALESAGYPKIVNILSGKYVPNDQYDEKILQLFTATVIQQLNPVELLPYLVQYGVVGEEEKEHIRAEDMNHGAQRASYILLSYLPSRVEDWFKYFLKALIECRCEELAETLEPDLFSKIMVQRRAEQEETMAKRKEEQEQKALIQSQLEQQETLNLNEHRLSNTASVGVNILSDDGEVDVDLAANKPESSNPTSVNPSKLEMEDSPSMLDFCELLDDAPSGLFEKETIEGNEKGVKGRQQNGKVIETGNMDTKSNKDIGTIRYDRTFLLSLRQSPLANYVPRQLLKYPEISLVLPKPTEYDKGYGGARPKVQTGNVVKMTPTNGQRDGTNENRNQKKDIDDLAKDLDDLLLGSLSTPENCDGIKDLTRVDTIYNRSEMAEVQPELNFDIEFGMNDLTNEEKIYNRLGMDDLQLDYIETDHDEIDGIEDKEIDMREYQKELAREGLDGENVIIMAPTNSGKTRVSIRIVQEHLRRHRREQKIASVIFLVQDEILAIQQAKEFAERLPAYRTKVISGTTQRDKKEYLKDFIDKRDILVVTAQVLINSLELGEIRDLTRFTMLVFDECHHANKKHPYNQILSKYMDLKIVENVDASILPQVVGMTASLGCGGYLEERLASTHMRQVMANMDAKYLCTVRRNIEELKRHVKSPKEEIRQVQKRVDGGFGIAINRIIDKIGDFMVSQLEESYPNIKDMIQLPSARGTEQFLQWLADFKKLVAAVKKHAARVLNPCRHHLEAYNMALLIYKDARVKDARRIIDRFIIQFKLQEEKDNTDNFLIELYDGLHPDRFDTELENPKLIEMQSIILGILGKDENARGIIFVKTRQLAQALIAWMNESDVLNKFHAEEFVGQNAPAFKGGSTKSHQADAMDYFRDGRHKILVATSVLEEGIDVTKCNLVIRYEHVTNEIVRLQSRGRARAANSRYFVLTEVGSWIVAKEEKNRRLEILMNKLVPSLQVYVEDHQNLWEREIRNIQTEFKDEERLQQQQREANMTDKQVSIQCLNCQTEICKSTDIKLIQKSHHVIMGLEAAERFLYLSSPVPEFIDEDLQFHGAIFCIKCFYCLGGICQYKHAKFPLLKIGRWRDENGKKAYKKWKKVNFRMEAFTIEDLREVAEQRRGLLLDQY